MSRDVMTAEAANSIVSDITNKRNAEIFLNTQQAPFTTQAVTFDLSSAVTRAQAKVIGFPFKTFYVQDATDTNVVLSTVVNSNDEVQSPFKIRKNDVWSGDQVTNKMFLFWDAQPGKSVTIIFFTNAEFRSGSQISVTGGGVSIVDGSTVVNGGQSVLVAGIATVVAPQLSTRKKATLQNKTGAAIWIGDVTVATSGSNQGIEIPADAIIFWQNTAALYAISVAGGNVNLMEES